jgi:hypothetical protein
VAATLDEIKAWRPAVLAGSGLADCLCPDADDSAGGKFLADVRDAVVEGIEAETFDPDSDDRDNYNGEISQIADAAPDIYTHQKWSEFVDLGAYQEEPEHGEWPDDLDKAASIALYQIAEHLVYGLLREWREGLAEQANDDDAEDDE